MSAKATFWAWEQEGVTGNNKLVLLCYAQYANDCDLSWPGKGTVSRLCGISKATVKRAVKWLCENGFMRENGHSFTKTDDERSRETIRYELASSGFKLNPVDHSSGVTVNRVQNEPGAICNSSGVTVNPNPINKHKPTNKKITCRKPESFKRFFAAYPVNKKGGRDESAWKKAKSLNLADEDFEAMIVDLEQREQKTPRWFSTYAPGICKYLDEHFWKSPIVPEAHDATGKPNSSAGQAAGQIDHESTNWFEEADEGGCSSGERSLQAPDSKMHGLEASS